MEIAMAAAGFSAARRTKCVGPWALASIAGHRRQAHWGALGVERLPGMLEGRSAREATLPLAAPSEGNDIVSDYRGTGLTLGRHPVALLRRKLDRLRVVRAAQLSELKSGLKVCVAGIVTHRQRPETASGVIFMSLKDEPGISNLIVWPSVQLRHRESVFGARMMVGPRGAAERNERRPCHCADDARLLALAGAHPDGFTRLQVTASNRSCTVSSSNGPKCRILCK